MLNICEIYHIYATYMTDEIVSHICTLFGTYIVHTCETIQLSYMPHICDIFRIYLTYMKCSIFYIFNLYVIYGTYMPNCMSYMEHICAAYMRCIYVVYMLAYMQTYMTTYMLHRAFSAAVPKIWNAIPLSIRDSPTVDVFKRRLTYYFDSR